MYSRILWYTHICIETVCGPALLLFGPSFRLLVENSKVVPVVGSHSKPVCPTNEPPSTQLPVGHLIAEEMGDLQGCMVVRGEALSG